jgi:RNA polymerase sigma-70 factor (ECF subfamily)
MIDAVVARAQAGDSDAFTELYNKFKSKVSGQIYKMTRDSYRTEDLTQDVFITVFRKLPKFQGHSAFSTWLYRVAFNVVLMDVRSRKKRLQTVPIDDSTDSRPQSAFRTDSVLHLDMTRAIANLPEGYRKYFTSTYVFGNMHKDNARIFHSSVGASKSQSSKGRARMRQVLEAR